MTERGIGAEITNSYTLGIISDPIFGVNKVVTNNGQITGTEAWGFSWEFPTKWSNLRDYFKQIPNFETDIVIDYLEQNNQSLEDHLDTAFLKTSGGIIQGTVIISGDLRAGNVDNAILPVNELGGQTVFISPAPNYYTMYYDATSFGSGFFSGQSFEYVLATDVNGALYLNTPTGQLLRLRQNNVTKAYVDAAGDFVIVGSNNVQGTLWQDSSSSGISTSTTVNLAGWNMISSVYRQAGPGLIWALNCTTTGVASTNVMTLRRLGTTCGNVSVTGNTATWGTTSDYRRKNEVGPIINPIEQIKRLRPIEFVWKT